MKSKKKKLARIQVVAKSHKKVVEKTPKERTVFIFKPSVLKRGLAKTFMGKVQALAGVQLVAIKQESMSRIKAKTHYAEHREKKFFEELVLMMTSQEVIIILLEGKDAVASARQLSEDLRKEFPTGELTDNGTHSSANLEAAIRETRLHFPAFYTE